uniref:Cytochrome c oxidase subunit 3 n=1 Tax=Ricinus sp. ADS-2020 TaxID=2794903 RepID=A0A7T1HF05_9NEOP|nr:cytochrome c oxidase subunit 3 [Ricinus sp. ADS-2020]
MLKHGFFSFHIVQSSPWPLLTSLSFFFSMIGLIECIYFYFFSYTFLVGNLLLLLTLWGWMRDMVRESTLEGMHTLKVQNGLKMGFILFIISEIFFFLSFFWGLYYVSISPSLEWPHLNISPINPLKIPLLGTIILISSGVSITWCHHLILEGTKPIFSFLSTILLGLTFTIIQLLEYYETSFSMCDGAFGSFFFVSTGFHGIHVIIGSFFLIFSFFRLIGNHFSSFHHVGFEAAVWYWHFVDVVWLLLYLSAYWWAW